MSIGPTCGKPISDRCALWLVIITSLALFIVAMYAASTDTHEKCYKTCKDAHKHGISISLLTCKTKCDKKFVK